MNPRSIVRFLHLYGLDAARGHHELEAVLGPDVMSYSTIAWALRSAIWTQTDPGTPHSEIDDAIVQALGELQFASVKQFVRRLCCSPATIYRHLTESLHFACKHLRCFPHDLTTARKALWVEQSNEPLQLIKSVQYNDGLPADRVRSMAGSIYSRHTSSC
jgi:hypothetical protein